MKKLILRIIFVFVLNVSIAQPGEVNLEYTESIDLYSNQVQDSYTISVALPYGYNNSKDEYDVLYILDANVTFGMARDIQLLMSFEPENSPLIIVGIGYKDFNNWISKRQRDYMQQESDIDQNSKFLLFIENELIPHIEITYRTTTERHIYGHSTAALFGLYALFNSNLFDGHIITSPSINEDNNFIKRLEERSKNKPLSGKVFISYGSDEKESFQKECQAFIERLKSRNHQHLKINAVESQGSHMSAMAPSFVVGLKFITNSGD